MDNCDIIKIIKKFDPSLRINFSINDIMINGNCDINNVESQLNYFEKIGLIKKKSNSRYNVENMCMLSQF